MSIGLIVPTYGAFGYARRTVESFFEHTPGDNKCYVIDDASPGWPSVNWDLWPAHAIAPTNYSTHLLLEAMPTGLDSTASDDACILGYHFRKHSGLTRSWNMGLRIGYMSR